MIDVVGVDFNYNGRIYYFDANHFKLKQNITVIVETERGLQFGRVIKPQITIDKNQVSLPLKKIVRIATRQDYLTNKKNIKDSALALKKCRELAKEENLDMKIIDCNYTFDRNQLIFRFLADARVDFRVLARNLASIYKTRIELRQVGVRDKAKEIGGLGPCGRQLCCNCFFKTFESVSINMAKNQNLSLNQNKINGACGRLLCCLKYEDEQYSKCRECLPKIGDVVKIEEGEGKVVSLDVMKRTYTVEIKEKGIIEKSIQCGSR